MSDYTNSAQLRKAMKQHRCSYCAEAIEPGETYHTWTGVSEGHWFTAKMHDECREDLIESGAVDYTPYDNERPPTSSGEGRDENNRLV